MLIIYYHYKEPTLKYRIGLRVFVVILLTNLFHSLEAFLTFLDLLFSYDFQIRSSNSSIKCCD